MSTDKISIGTQQFEDVDSIEQVQAYVEKDKAHIEATRQNTDSDTSTSTHTYTKQRLLEDRKTNEEILRSAQQKKEEALRILEELEEYDEEPTSFERQVWEAVQKMLAQKKLMQAKKQRSNAEKQVCEQQAWLTLYDDLTEKIEKYKDRVVDEEIGK